MNSSDPTIGVMIPTRDRAHLLRQSLQSVRDQSRPIQEILVSDNHSQVADNSWVAEVDDNRIRYHRHEQTLSLEDHWIWCIRHMKSDYICVLSDDDLWRPHHVETLRTMLRTFPNEAFYGTAAQTFSHETDPNQGVIFAPVWMCNLLTCEPLLIPPPVVNATFLAGTPFASCSVMFRNPGEKTLTSENLDVCIDVWLWFQLCQGRAVVYSPAITTLYRVHASNLSGATKRQRWRACNQKYFGLVKQALEAQGLNIAEGIDLLRTLTSDASFQFFVESLFDKSPLRFFISLYQASGALRDGKSLRGWIAMILTHKIQRRLFR